MIVTLDGPAGAGKSTAARLLAERLGFDFLDTGAMYRAVAFAGREAGIDFAAESALQEVVATVQLEMPAGRVVLNGRDITDLIRTPEITALSRPVADSPAVRAYLGELQRRLAGGRNLVTEGRDQGTVVFPHAECKFFLTASPEARARRRHQEMLRRGQTQSFEEVLAAQTERDARDTARAIAPMKPAEDAIIVDSTALGIEEVLAVMEQHVRGRQSPSRARSEAE
jgi:CMP/dCMP kinase